MKDTRLSQENTIAIGFNFFSALIFSTHLRWFISSVQSDLVLFIKMSSEQQRDRTHTHTHSQSSRVFSFSPASRTSEHFPPASQNSDDWICWERECASHIRFTFDMYLIICHNPRCRQLDTPNLHLDDICCYVKNPIPPEYWYGETLHRNNVRSRCVTIFDVVQKCHLLSFSPPWN